MSLTRETIPVEHTFHVKHQLAGCPLFHVKRSVNACLAISAFAFHVKHANTVVTLINNVRSDWEALIAQECDYAGAGKQLRLSAQGVDHQTAEKLGIEVGTLGRHAFAMLADSADVIESSRHD